MKGFILLALAVFAALQTVDSDCGSCKTMKWVNCQGAAPSCTCILPLDENNMQPIDCEKLVSKCFLMKAEMYRRRTGQDVRLNITGKPHEDAIVDNDGIYDPECEIDGKFKAKQCNRTEECWCVNSAGVRRSDKGDKNINCSKLVETFMIRFELRHKEVNSTVEEAALKTSAKNLLQTRYQFDSNLVKDIKVRPEPSNIGPNEADINEEYDPDGRYIVMDIAKPKGERATDLGTMAYYVEKDLKVSPLFSNGTSVQLNGGSQNLDLDKIVVYYVDEERPTITMRNPSDEN